MDSWVAAHWVEVAGFVTGATSVVLAWRRSMWNYPIGIANTLLFLVLFAESGLYADASLQVMFLILAVTGWIEWARARRRERAADLRRDDAFVGSASARVLAVSAIGFVVGTAVIAYVLATFTDSTTEVPDAAVTAGSLVAQYLLNRRCWQSWPVWLGVDVLSVGLYLYKDLWLTGILYVGFCVIVILALREWLGVLRRTRSTEEPEAAGV